MSDQLEKMRGMHNKFENNEMINKNEKALKDQIASLSNQNKDLAQKYERRQKIVQSLQSKIENLNREMEYRFAEAQNQTLKQSFINRQQARMQADALKNQKRELEISRKSLMKRVNALETENVRVIQERDQLESKFNRLLQQSQRQLTDLQCASNQLSILRKNSEETQAVKIKELNETNANLLKSLSEMKVDLSNALRQNNDLQQDLDDYKQANKRLEADLIYLKQSQQREISIIDDKCEHVRNQNGKMLEEIKYLREVELEQKKEIRRLEIARDNYKDQYLEIKAEKKQIERACYSKDEQIRRLTSNNPPHFQFNSSEQKKFETPLNYGQTMSSNYDSRVRMVTDIKDLITQYKQGKSSKKQQLNFQN